MTLKKILDFYINSSIHVALAVVSLSLITTLSLGLAADKDLLIFIFFGTITGYNFVKYAGVAKLHHRSLAKSLRSIQIFSLFCFLGFVIFFFRIEKVIMIWIGLFGLLTLLYALPVFSRRRNLRSISGVKIFIIAFVWSGVTVVLPAAETAAAVSWEIFWEFVQRFLFVLVLILPFEIRDLKYDLQQLGTIPQNVGVTKTKLLGLLLLLIVVLIEFLQSPVESAAFLSLLGTSVITAGFTLKAKEHQSSYYSSFWVEAVSIFWLFLLWLLAII